MPVRPTPRHAATPLESRNHEKVIIVGGGLIGLSIALELHYRGIPATVLETSRAMGHASTAAAGMLAAKDPHNPPELQELSRYSLSLYPEFLARIERLSGLSIPLQTKVTIQYTLGGTERLDEYSLDPRQLATALREAVSAVGIDLRENHAPFDFPQLPADKVILATGAWSGAIPSSLHLPITPRKGQMLRVTLPEDLRDLREVHRSEHVYIVPRTQGPQAGSALIGATVEDAGFDTLTHAYDLSHLRALAAELLPELASEEAAPHLESWAGLRPATPDNLPLLGRFGGTLIASGHFRNGILLAPATAVLLADLIESKPLAVDLSNFAPDRFGSD